MTRCEWTTCPPPDGKQEMQAAGRIHRLGQSKEVLIKRFAFKVRKAA